MKRVHFIIDRSRIVDFLVTPVRFNRQRLRSRGYDVRFYYRPSRRVYSCDILCLVSKPTLHWTNETEAVIGEGSPTLDLLREARDEAGKLVWLDSSDSTGVTHFELLPYLDLYLKKHLLYDRSRYRQPMYGGRIYSDYYNREFGVADTEVFEQYYPLAEEQQSKVQLSWNIALGELRHAFTWWSRVRRLLPGLLPARLDIPFAQPAKPRPLDLFLRASANWHRETVVYHRKELIRRLQGIIDSHELTASVGSTASSKLRPREYRRQGEASKIVLGPFGWGELTFRDYEALMFGALLLRPNNSHMYTWPDLFHHGDTCIYYQWDFSDLEDKVMRYLADAKERTRIAAAGQAAYREVLSSAGMERFSDWFVQQIEL